MTIRQLKDIILIRINNEIQKNLFYKTNKDKLSSLNTNEIDII